MGFCAAYAHFGPRRHASIVHHWIFPSNIIFYSSRKALHQFTFLTPASRVPFFPPGDGATSGRGAFASAHYDVRIGNPGRHFPIVQHRAAAWATKQSQMAGYFGVKAMGPKAHQCSLLCLVLDTGSRPPRFLPIRKTSANWRSLKCRLLCDAWRRSPPSDAAAADVGAHSEAG